MWCKKKTTEKKIKILTFGPGRTNESFSCGELHCGWKCKWAKREINSYVSRDCAEAARVRRTKERRKRPVGEFLGDADGLTDSCNKGCDVVWIGRKGGRMKNEWKELERWGRDGASALHTQANDTAALCRTVLGQNVANKSHCYLDFEVTLNCTSQDIRSSNNNEQH